MSSEVGDVMTPEEAKVEKQRLKDQVADMDRRIARLEAAGEA